MKSLLGTCEKHITAFRGVLELLKKATEFEFFPHTEGNFGKDGNLLGPVKVVRRPQMDGTIMWSVNVGFDAVVDKYGYLVVEPIPSSRTKEYLQATRYDRFTDAARCAKRLADQYTEICKEHGVKICQ